MGDTEPVTGSLHHVELWVPNLTRAEREWGWLLGELGYRLEDQDWPAGRSWHLGGTYLVLEQSPDLTADRHERCRPGLNHLAFHAGGPDRVDVLTEQAPAHGWELMFADRHPHAGGPQHYAAFLQNSDGYQVELVAAGFERRPAEEAAKLDRPRTEDEGVRP